MKTELINFKQKMLDVNLTIKEKKAIQAIPTPQNIYKKINFKNFINEKYYLLLDMYNEVLLNKYNIDKISFDDFCNLIYDEININ
jgi:hypothetical protein